LILALLALAFWLGMLYQNRAAGEGGRSSRSVQLPETPSSLAEAQAGQTKPAAPVSPPVIGPGSAPEPSLSAHLPDPPDAFIEPFGDSVLRRSDDPAMAAAGSGTAGSLNPKRPAGPVGGTDSASAAAEPSSVRPSPDSPPDPSATDGPAVEPESGIGPDPKRPFSLLVASFLKKERAAQAMLVFKEKGVDTYWVRQDNREKGQVFMVLTYGFATKEEAAQVRVDKNLKGSLIQDRPLGILMGRSDKVDDLQPLAGSLATAGYSPYWVPSADGVFFLFVGAFRTEETARKEWDRLAADGFQGRIVQR
jgi:cell division septation protein DedD